jgi:uncharacterized membrane protein
MVTFASTPSAEPLTSQTHQEKDERPTNVGQRERLITGAIGGILATRAVLKPSLGSLILGGVGAMLVRRAYTGHCPAYAKLGMNTARHTAQPSDYFRDGLHVSVSYTIQKNEQELYAFWRNFENLPRFMYHLQSVTRIDDQRSHWVVRGPAGMSVKWDAEIINDQPHRLISWRSVENADVHNAGSVTFAPAPGGRGTEVRVEIEYIPPAGRLGQAVAWLFGEEPHQQISDDLRRFKQLMETGEVPTTEGQPRGQCC